MGGISLYCWCRYFYTGGYFSILLMSCFIWSAALNSSDLLLLHFIITVASHVTIILIYTPFQTLKHTNIHIYSYTYLYRHRS